MPTARVPACLEFTLGIGDARIGAAAHRTDFDIRASDGPALLVVYDTGNLRQAGKLYLNMGRLAVGDGDCIVLRHLSRIAGFVKIRDSILSRHLSKAGRAGFVRHFAEACSAGDRHD